MCLTDNFKQKCGRYDYEIYALSAFNNCDLNHLQAFCDSEPIYTY